MPAMNSLTVLLYLFGHAGSIRRVASSPMAVPVGILLVFSAAVARNYDQLWFGEMPARLLTPLLFSLISGIWLLIFVYNAWTRRPGDPEESGPTGGRIIVSFFGCFWMTAPVAWLYAIPVERWCDPEDAARWNLRLLAVVSVWRVLLMSRVVAVIGGWPFWKGLGVVLFPASLEALAISISNAGFGRRLMAGMGGLRNSPAEDVTFSAFQTAVGLSIAAFALAVMLCITFGFKQRPGAAAWKPEKEVRWWQVPWAALVLVAALWTWISLQPQQEQRLTQHAKELIRRKDWHGLVAFLSQHRQEEFAPSIPLPPTAWEYQDVQQLPFVIEKLTPETPAWIRELYAGYLDIVLEQGFPARLLESDGGFAKVLLAGEKISEIRRVAKRHAEVIRRYAGVWTDENGQRLDLQEKLTMLLLLPD
jgi:hypothetical protein